jgi:hypothetical protein
VRRAASNSRPALRSFEATNYQPSLPFASSDASHHNAI